jgi:phage terminase large subunit
MIKALQASCVFEKNSKAQTKIVVNQGSSRSGKTYSILQLLIFVKSVQEKDQIFTIVRKTFPSLRMTAMRDFIEILSQHGMYDEKCHNKTENIYELNGNIFEFISLDQPQKKRGAKRHYLFLNEANELSLEDWVQLAIRTEKQIFLDYNPSIPPDHWIYEKVLPRDDCTFIHSTYKDNPWLPESMVKEIELLKEMDEEYWKIYGLGIPGQIKGVIFSNWEQVDRMPNDQDCRWVSYGMDYGFQTDPTALIKVVKFDDQLWIDELIYSRGLIATELARWMNELGITDKDRIISDRKPELIYELKKLGFNIEPAYKPAGIIKTRIDILKRYKMNVTKSSVNLIRELRNYKWRTTADGRELNEPIDRYNHAIDALGYVITSLEFMQKRKMRVSAIRMFE